MKTDLVGRIDRIPLSPRHAFYPVFEAVSNSIHAIEATQRTDGVIEVELRRETSQRRLEIDAEHTEPITEVRVTDNGVGFTAPNFAAFEELDTRYKLALGGKGVGRLTWLKVFEAVRIESVYEANGGYRRRTFAFVLPGGVEYLRDEPLANGQPAALRTTIMMSRPRDTYREILHQRATTVAAALVRHFLFYLLGEKAPKIEVMDGTTVVAVRADNITARETGEIDLKGQRFKIEHLKVRSPEKRQHVAYYCANSRPVKEERLNHLPDTPFYDADASYFYHGYLFSPYLDSRANEQRTGFDIPEEPELSDLSYRDLRGAVRTAADRYLGPQLTELARARDERVTRVFEQRLPELNYVRDQNRDEILSIPLDASDAQVEEVIGSIHLRNQKTGRELMERLVADMRDETTIDLAAFEKSFADRVERITRPSQANLASYLLFRHSIIELYRQLLKKSGDRFQLEAAIHQLLFPMRMDVDPTRAKLPHNLWLIDERLTYASYIASDQPLKKHKVLFSVESTEEPDIVAYFNLGFSSEDPSEGSLRTVVIVELKRPGPLKKREENPWEQVMRYIDAIRNGFYAEGSGQKIQATESTLFYCYIVCDLDSDVIKQLINDYQFTPLFDGGEGYFLYNVPRKAYVELVPFEKLLRDAERRHRAFFERLGVVPR